MSSIVFDEPPVQPAIDFFAAVQGISLTPAERKSVQAAREKLNTAATLAGTHRDFRSASTAGESWRFQDRIWAAANLFMANPTQETADHVGMVVAMSKAAETTSIELQNVVGQLHVKLALEVLPIAVRVIDSAVAVIEPQVATARAALESAPGLEAEVKFFDRRVASLHQVIADERAVAAADALRWLGINCQV